MVKKNACYKAVKYGSIYLNHTPKIRVLYQHFFKSWVIRLVETSQESKISVLISTFQWVYNQIHYRHQINAFCKVTLTLLFKGRKQKLPIDCPLLTCIHTWNHHSDSFSVVLSALCHQSFALQHLTAQTSVPYLHRIHRRQLVLFDCAWQTVDCFPYVFYEGHQATVVSPQNVGLEASSAPLRYYANPVWLRAALVGYLEERSRCTRRRCHWGSADVAITQKQVKNMRAKTG